MLKKTAIYAFMLLSELIITVSVAVFVMRFCLLSNLNQTVSLFLGMASSLAANTYIKFRHHLTE